MGSKGTGSWEHAHLSGAGQGLPGAAASCPGSTPEPSPAPPGRRPRWRVGGRGEGGKFLMKPRLLDGSLVVGGPEPAGWLRQFLFNRKRMTLVSF